MLSSLDAVDKDALLDGALARLSRPSGVPRKRHGPSMLPRAAAAVPTPGPLRVAPHPNAPAALVIGSVDGLVKYCAVSGTCQTAKAKRGGERDW